MEEQASLGGSPTAALSVRSELEYRGPSHLREQRPPLNPAWYLSFSEALPSLLASLVSCNRPTVSSAEALGWTPWTPWSPCSQSCLVPGGGPSWQRRFRLCPGPKDACHGEAIQEEPCSAPLCPGMNPGVDRHFSGVGSHEPWSGGKGTEGESTPGYCP